MATRNTAPADQGTTQQSADAALQSGQADPALAGAEQRTTMEIVVGRFHVRAARAEGFRRAGRLWPFEGVEVDESELSVEQIEQLLAEPMLVVTPIAAAAAE